MPSPPTSPRERYRQQVRDEIKAHARAQVAESGAAAVSLNAIAKQLGMSGPAMYRYYGSRDDLLTELVLDAYRDLAAVTRAAGEAAASPVGGASGGTAGPPAVRRVAAALRDWALRDPQRYLLLFGTPVPGYRAPSDTTEVARQVMATVTEAFGADAPPDRPLVFWTRLHGVLSLELAGHFAGMPFDPAQLYAAEVDGLLTPRAAPDVRAG